MENKYIVSFSGGKDSTAMLLRLIEEKKPIDEIIFCDTGKEFPDMIKHIKKVEDYIQRPITTLKPEKLLTIYLPSKKEKKLATFQMLKDMDGLLQQEDGVRQC